VQSQGALWDTDTPPVTMRYVYTFQRQFVMLRASDLAPLIKTFGPSEPNFFKQPAHGLMYMAPSSSVQAPVFIVKVYLYAKKAIAEESVNYLFLSTG